MTLIMTKEGISSTHLDQFVSARVRIVQIAEKCTIKDMTSNELIYNTELQIYVRAVCSSTMYMISISK